MIYLIGTGLYYLSDLPLRALDPLRSCDEVFLERYTNLNDISFLHELEEKIDKKVTIKDRQFFESEEPIKIGKTKDIALLIPGDPLAATTHISLLSEAKKEGIKYKIIHASSIFSAIGATGLSLYKFGAVTSIPLDSKKLHITSFMDVIKKNKLNGLHSLVLLEAQSKDTFVSEREAVELLEELGNDFIEKDKIIILSKAGSEEEIISLFTRLEKTLEPPISLIIPGELSIIEEENMRVLLQ
ncbi:diphthine synthase [Candidatus Parvarchaeota archaeon]|uniref:Diphthine synthase n=1 Tax=Candidatus Acidifodinimicrobium mancum TaxID=2898728 RepID=A0A8T3UYC3_9ARCH|nr:diphthine synthase [Candidatus Acidifodinimicrobium mancum]